MGVMVKPMAAMVPPPFGGFRGSMRLWSWVVELKHAWADAIVIENRTW
jgi:hypothetical protein